MSWFRRQKTLASPRAAELAERWAGRIIAAQTRLADRLNRQTAYWSRSAKLTALILFCLAFGGACLCLLIYSF